MKTTNIFSRTINLAATLVLSGASVHAAAFVNTGTGADGAGELFAGLHATGGQGSGVSVVIDLGAVSRLSNALPGTVFTGGGTNLATNWSIGTDLATQFGTTWYDRTDLVWSAVSAVVGTVPSTNTDFINTLYGSIASTNVFPLGTTAYNRNTSSTQSTIAGRIVNNMANPSVGSGGFSNAGAGATSNIAIELSSDVNGYALWMPNGSLVSGLGNNPFGGFNNPVGTNFEQAFASGQITPGVEGALDVFRMDRSISSDPEATAPGTGVGPGTYQFTLKIDQGGNITASVLPVPEPASIALLMSGGLLFLGVRRRGTGARAEAATIA